MIIAHNVLLGVVKAFKIDFLFLPKSGSNLSCSQASKLPISTQRSSLTQLIIPPQKNKKTPLLSREVYLALRLQLPTKTSALNGSFADRPTFGKGTKTSSMLLTRIFIFLLICEIIFTPVCFSPDFSKVEDANQTKGAQSSIFLQSSVAAVNARDGH